MVRVLLGLWIILAPVWLYHELAKKITVLEKKIEDLEVDVGDTETSCGSIHSLLEEK